MASKIHYSGRVKRPKSHGGPKGSKPVQRHPPGIQQGPRKQSSSKIHYSGPKKKWVVPKKIKTPNVLPQRTVSTGGLSDKFRTVSTGGGSSLRKKHPTSYATTATGETFRIKGKLGLEARQHYASQGVSISSRPPGQDAQQNLSDRFGITTYTKWGGVSTQPRSGSVLREQQKLSDQYGITTYNKDGTVATTPNTTGPRLEKASTKPWWLPF